MIQNKKIATGGGLVLAGLAAYGLYKYSRMSTDDRNSMMTNLKDKGRKLYDSIPQNMKNMMGKNGGSMNTSNAMGANSKFGEGNDYVS